MKAFIRWADRFCARHPRFGVYNLMRFLVIGNAAVWLLSSMDRTGTVIFYLALYPQMVLQGQIWRLVTFVFIPASSGLLTLLFLYFYYFIGSTMEREWGQAKFSLYFLFGMLFTVIYAFAVYFITGKSPSPYSVAEFIYLSMFFSFATYYPDVQVLLFFILPVKVKWLAWVDAAFFLFSMLTMSFPERLLPLIAVLNYLLFCGDILFAGLAPARFAQRRKTISFRREAQRVRQEQKNAPYRFKCAVCGRTDTEHPELEFRYCSRCAGYHCFCQEHINNHIHFNQ
jgi:hypothetical protein